MKISYKNDPNKLIRDIDYVTLKSLQEAFANNKTWTEAFKSEPEPSKFVNFINDLCSGECEDFPD